MARMIVGGRTLELTMEQVAHKMRGVQPEPIREHLVEMLGTVYPPKQVLAVVTGWDRQSFTTMEAQRVLSKVGFVCRRAGERPDGVPAWVLQNDSDLEGPESPLEGRVEALEASLTVMEQAIANLTSRISKVENGVSGAA